MSDVITTAETTYALAGPAVIARDFGSELVIANLDTGIFYSCGGSAAAIWQRLEQGWSAQDMTATFTAASPDRVRTSIEQFIATLAFEALIVPCRTELNADRIVPADPLSFEDPTLERFDDLQGLLLVDPIHDVTEQGWPLQHP